MSRPISELLEALALSSKVIKPPEGQIYNPDLPDGPLNPDIEIKDQYARVMRIGGVYNGAGLPLKESGQRFLMDPRLVDFAFDDTAIDPNTIRAKIDPDHAHPTSNSNALFSLVQSEVDAPYNQIDLVAQSRAAYSNYKNRFNAQAPPEPEAPRSYDNIGRMEETTQEPRDARATNDLPPRYPTDIEPPAYPPPGAAPPADMPHAGNTGSPSFSDLLYGKGPDRASY